MVYGKESCPEEEILVIVRGWTSHSCQPIPHRRWECCRKEQGDSEHHILPLSQDWSKGCAGPWGMTDCMAWSVSAWGRQKAKALLNCLCIKALLLFTSAEKDVTPVFLPKFEPGPLFFPLQSTQCFALWWHSMLLSVLKCYTAALPDRSHG